MVAMSTTRMVRSQTAKSMPPARGVPVAWSVTVQWVHHCHTIHSPMPSRRNGNSSARTALPSASGAVDGAGDVV